MTSHLGVLLLFAAAVSVVFAVLMRDDAREQARLGGRIFGGLVGGALVVGVTPVPAAGEDDDVGRSAHAENATRPRP